MSKPILINGMIDSVTPKGLGRIAGKTPCYVPHTATGDQVVVRVVKETPHYRIGHVADFLERSPDRASPFCPHFGKCGGCQLMHLRLDRQRGIKQDWVERGLREWGLSPTVLPWIGSDSVVSRRRIRLQATRDGRWGMNRWHSSMVEAIGACPVILPTLQGCMAQLMKGPAPPSDARVDLIQIGDGCWATVWGMGETESERQGWHDALGLVGSRWHHATGGWEDIGETVGMESVGGVVMPIRMGAFTQHHPGLIEALVGVVMRESSGEGVVWDLYGGGGLFGYHARVRGANRVVIVESNPMALLDARSNALYGDGCEVIDGLVGDFLTGEASMGGADWVIADPPRGGLGGEVIRGLLNRGIPKITVVHCQWESMVRDIGGLGRGGYTVKWVQPIDLFPHTVHFELVTHLEKEG